MKHTNKEVLAKGLKFMAGALPLAFLGPVIIFSAFKNQEHPYYIPILIAGILAMFAAILLLFKGISVIIKALFD
ncbi:MAG TPA: DUF6095 family protein [Salinimicrobium sp.]|nr:DUF6095 family protein [Salinimicrobium sp.]